MNRDDVLAQVTLDPDVSGLPGSAKLQEFANAAGGWGLVLILIAFLVAVVTWAFGSHSQNYQYAVAGRRGVLIALAAALLIGGAATLINFFWSAGGSI